MGICLALAKLHFYISIQPVEDVLVHRQLWYYGIIECCVAYGVGSRIGVTEASRNYSSYTGLASSLSCNHRPMHADLSLECLMASVCFGGGGFFSLSISVECFFTE